MVGTWLVGGDMITPHAYHTATLLRDGWVLVAGGLVNDRLDGLASAATELFDPDREVWVPAQAMATARWGHTATLLPDGRVLVAGSYVNSGDSLASAELYDPASGRWAPAGTMNRGRGGHTATLLLDGKVLVVGGGAEASQLEGPLRGASAELFDPQTGRWTVTGSMVEPRAEFTATLLRDGRVLVAGGDGSFTTAEVYDPTTGRWTLTGSMTNGRFGHTATLLADGMVLVTGGCACSDPDAGETAAAERYDPRSGTWTVTGSMGSARIFHAATALNDGMVLVVDDGLYDRPSSAELYDPRSGRWSVTTGPTVPRVGYTETLLLDGRVLVTGDYSHNDLTTELYDSASGT
jgi:phage baseplate assembly protein gpV